MKTAILISGHMRSFDRCLPNLAWMLFRHFPGADFYVSTVLDEDADKAQLLRVKYPNAKVEIEAVKEQPQIPLPAGCPTEWVLGKPYTHEPYFISVSPQAVLAQLWQLNECWKLFVKHNAGKYDAVIRCRPDLWFHSFDAPRDPGINDAFVPNWGQFGGVNDRFSVLGLGAAHDYFTTFGKVDSLWRDGCPIHPESLVAASLDSGGCRVERLPNAVFSTLRKTGEMRPPEITAVDMLGSR